VVRIRDRAARHCRSAPLRADWRFDGDFLAVEQSASDPPGLSRCEVVCSGLPILTTTVRVELPTYSGRPATPKPCAWSSTYLADLYEWETGLGLRTAVLLRGRQTALIAHHVTTPGPAALRLDLAPRIVAEPRAGVPGVVRLRGPRRVKIDVIPIGQAPPGGLSVEDSTLCLRADISPGGAWLPLLLTWDPEHLRRRPLWRSLTITERSRVCPGSEAFAARVAWSRDDSLLVYRSLGPLALRAVLGHPTSLRMVVGPFTISGEWKPLAQLGES
jgi:hypothetical protein